MLSMDYTVLSLAEVRGQLDATARETQAAFGDLSERQLNWRPDESRWSVAQCFEHLLAANRLMFRAAEEALRASAPRSVWQRMPVLPGVYGRMLIRSQSPTATRKFTAAPSARPTTSAIPLYVIPRFIDQHRDAVAAVHALDEREAARAIMTSPFVRFITYSVLDGWRLVVAHDRRHFEQARRVTLVPEFPAE
jgi:DinB superfamily